MDFTVNAKQSLSLFPDFTNADSHIFIYFVSLLLHNYIIFYVRVHFATYMCYINYIFMSYAHFAYSYYSQFSGKINFMHYVIGYIALLCITSK